MKEIKYGRILKSKSNAGVYKIHVLNCNKYYIEETGRNLDKRIYEHKKKTLKLVTQQTLQFFITF